jgi:hypothetical protein
MESNEPHQRTQPFDVLQIYRNNSDLTNFTSADFEGTEPEDDITDVLVVMGCILLMFMFVTVCMLFLKQLLIPEEEILDEEIIDCSRQSHPDRIAQIEKRLIARKWSKNDATSCDEAEDVTGDDESDEELAIKKVARVENNHSSNQEKSSETTANLRKKMNRAESGSSSLSSSSAWSFRPEAGCAICLCNFEDKQLVCEANSGKCRHKFHHTCMSSWLLKNGRCPACRCDYLEEGGT